MEQNEKETPEEWTDSTHSDREATVSTALPVNYRAKTQK
jgi:hypothetical protein